MRASLGQGRQARTRSSVIASGRQTCMGWVRGSEARRAVTGATGVRRQAVPAPRAPAAAPEQCGVLRPTDIATRLAASYPIHCPRNGSLPRKRLASRPVARIRRRLEADHHHAPAATGRLGKVLVQVAHCLPALRHCAGRPPGSGTRPRQPGGGLLRLPDPADAEGLLRFKDPADGTGRALPERAELAEAAPRRAGAGDHRVGVGGPAREVPEETGRIVPEVVEPPPRAGSAPLGRHWLPGPCPTCHVVQRSAR
jgi:hypothetical protein